MSTKHNKGGDKSWKSINAKAPETYHTFVDGLVGSGKFESKSHVIRNALDLLAKLEIGNTPVQKSTGIPECQAASGLMGLYSPIHAFDFSAIIRDASVLHLAIRDFRTFISLYEHNQSLLHRAERLLPTRIYLHASFVDKKGVFWGGDEAPSGSHYKMDISNDIHEALFDFAFSSGVSFEQYVMGGDHPFKLVGVNRLPRSFLYTGTHLWENIERGAPDDFPLDQYIHSFEMNSGPLNRNRYIERQLKVLASYGPSFNILDRYIDFYLNGEKKEVVATATPRPRNGVAKKANK
jgi:Bacterial antitoxin of ParD toxin-antitoxin type II system and RHH